LTVRREMFNRWDSMKTESHNDRYPFVGFRCDHELDRESRDIARTRRVNKSALIKELIERGLQKTKRTGNHRAA
jgi:hypothetical protein